MKLRHSFIYRLPLFRLNMLFNPPFRIASVATHDDQLSGPQRAVVDATALQVVTGLIVKF